MDSNPTSTNENVEFFNETILNKLWREVFFFFIFFFIIDRYVPFTFSMNNSNDITHSLRHSGRT